jgi:hypothetical protein
LTLRHAHRSSFDLCVLEPVRPLLSFVGRLLRPPQFLGGFFEVITAVAMTEDDEKASIAQLDDAWLQDWLTYEEQPENAITVPTTTRKWDEGPSMFTHAACARCSFHYRSWGACSSPYWRSLHLRGARTLAVSCADPRAPAAPEYPRLSRPHSAATSPRNAAGRGTPCGGNLRRCAASLHRARHLHPRPLSAAVANKDGRVGWPPGRHVFEELRAIGPEWYGSAATGLRVPHAHLTIGDIGYAQREELAEPESGVKRPARYPMDL